VEQELAARLREGQIAEFVKDDEVASDELIGDPALPPGAGLGLELVDEVDDVEEPPSAARCSRPRSAPCLAGGSCRAFPAGLAGCAGGNPGSVPGYG
jgi:hypothetical protein